MSNCNVDPLSALACMLNDEAIAGPNEEDRALARAHAEESVNADGPDDEDVPEDDDEEEDEDLLNEIDGVLFPVPPPDQVHRVPKRKKTNNTPASKAPRMKDLYVLSDVHCPAKQSETGFKATYNHYIPFCEENNITPAYEIGNGLNLYDDEAIANKSRGGYNVQRICKFFKWMIDKDLATNDNIKKAGSFFNKHIKFEYMVKHRRVHHPEKTGTTYYEYHGETFIKSNPVIAKLIDMVTKSTASRAMKNCEDFMSNLDTRVTEQECRGLLCAVFDPPQERKDHQNQSSLRRNLWRNTYCSQS